MQFIHFLFLTCVSSLYINEYNNLEQFYNQLNGSQWVKKCSHQWQFSSTIYNQSDPCEQDWYGITCNTNNTNIIKIELAFCQLKGNLQNLLSGFRHLQFVNMSQNHLSGRFPNDLQSLTQLSSLILNSNSLTGQIKPLSLTSIPSLTFLNLSSNSFTGSLPSLPVTLKRFSASNNSFSGNIQTFLENLHLLSDLLELDLSNNQISGSFATISSFPSNLKRLAISQNLIYGTLPLALSNLSHLNSLSLDLNSFHGVIPTSFNFFSKLYQFNLSYNAFTGSLPFNSTTSTHVLQVLDVSHNYLTGSIPVSFSNLTNLRSLILSSNLLTGSIPSCLFNFTQLVNLGLSNNYFTQTLPSVFQLSSLQNLYLSQNFLSSTLPRSFQLMTNIFLVDLSGNEFIGTIPNNLFNESVLTLRYLYLHQNRLTGAFPSSLTKQQELLHLFLFDNRLTQIIPQAIGSLTQLQTLLIQGNHFQGHPADFLTNSSSHKTFFNSLEALDISNNRFSGTFPNEIFQSNNLKYLAIISTCFYGSISAKICNLTKLETLLLDGLRAGRQCELSLFDPAAIFSHSFYILDITKTIEIPDCIWSMSTLKTLHLSGNQLEGSIPQSTSLQLENVNDLTLSYNLFHGDIPEQILKKKYKKLDLSHNKFSGTCDKLISWNDSKTTSLSLNGNRISGDLPTTLKSIEEIDILSGNLFTCHNHRKHLPSNDPNKDSYVCGSDDYDVTLQVWLGLFGVVCLLLFVMYYCYTVNKTQPNRSKDSESSLWSSSTVLGAKTIRSPSTITTEVIPTTTGITKSTSKPKTISKSKSMSSTEAGEASEATQTTETTEATGETGETVTEEESSLRCHQSILTTFSLYYQQLKQFIISTSELLNKWIVYSKKISAEDSPDLFRYINLLTSIRRITTYLTLLLVCPCMIYYPLAKVFGKAGTHTHQYRWLFSVVYLTGIRPSIFLGIILVVGSLYFFYQIVWTETKLHHLNLRKTSRAVHPNIISDPFLLNSVISDNHPIDKRFSDKNRKNIYYSYAAVCCLLFFNTVIVICIKGIYVYATLHNNLTFNWKLLLKILLSFFDLIWGNYILSKIISTFLSFMRSKVKVRLHLFLLIVNGIIAPIIASVLTDDNCFAALFTEQSEITSFAAFTYCKRLDTSSNGRSIDTDFDSLSLQQTAVVVGAGGAGGGGHGIQESTSNEPICEEFDSINLATSYAPPFIYSYQCCSSILTNFIPVVVFSCIVLSFVLPCLYFLLSYLSSNTPTSQKRFLRIPGIFSPVQSLQNPHHNVFHAGIILSSVLQQIMLLLTFGVASPPLAITIYVTIQITCWQWQIYIGRYLMVTREIERPVVTELTTSIHSTVSFAIEYERQYSGILLLERSCLDVWLGPVQSVWTIIDVSSFFYGIMMVDMAGDQIGWMKAICYFTIPVYFFPLLLRFIYRQYWRFCCCCCNCCRWGKEWKEEQEKKRKEREEELRMEEEEEMNERERRRGNSTMSMIHERPNSGRPTIHSIPLESAFF